MDSVRRIGRSTAAGSNGYRAPPDNIEISQPAAGRALVTLASATLPRSDQTNLQRPDVPFLAQLIANKQNLPQARERRRAEPQEAIAAYAAAGRAA